MIWIVTLNPAVDRTLTVPGFAPDKVQKAEADVRTPGGKGANVAMTLAQLGVKCAITGAVGGDSGRRIREYLTSMGVEDALVETNAPTRVNIKIYDPLRNQTTDINLPGGELDGKTLGLVEERVFSSLREEDVLVLTGSLPPGAPEDIYARWVGRAGRMGIRTVLDAVGESLRRGLAAGPVLVKPNLEELAGWLGFFPKTERELKDAALALWAAGAEYAAVSRGEQGALLAHGGRVLTGRPRHRQAGSTVGAGDAMVAAMTARLGDMEAMLRCGLAAGGARVCCRGGDFLQAYERLAGQAEISSL